MSRINAATSQPFQKYSEDPTAYVANLTPEQKSAISNVASLQGMTTPYYQVATGLTGMGAQGVGRLTGAQIGEYMNPYMSQVVDPVRAAINQQSGMQLAQQQGEAIRGGAFGGERAGLQRGALRGQQALGLGQALSPLYQTGYGQALQTALGQQGVEAANLQRLLSAGAQFGQLGTAAQQAALQQASAQLQAGTLEQQTSTAQKQALYNEFQKQRMYPLQTAQLYAQTAGAIGPLYGSQSAGYQQLPFFGGLAATGGAIKGYDEGLGAARMGGAVVDLEPGKDYWRGGYADGGSPDFSYLVEQHRAGIMPRSEEISFPTGEYHVGRSPEMGELPERRPGLIERGIKGVMSDPEAAYEKAKGLGSSLKTGYKFLTDGPGSLMGFADGGDVTDDAMSNLLNNPIKVSQAPQTQQAPEKQGSGLLGGLIKAGASMAANAYLPGSGAVVSGGLGALGLATGGVARDGYADRGAVEGEDDVFERGVIPSESAGRQLTREGRPLVSSKGATGIAQVLPSTAPEAAKLAGLPLDMERFKYDEDYNKALGRAYYNEQKRRFGTDELASAAYNAGPGRVQKALARAEREGGNFMDYLPAETRAYVPNVMRKAGLSQEAIGESISKLGPRERSMMALYPEAKGVPAGVMPGESGIGSAQVPEKGFLERVEERPERLIIPVLQGLGAMAGSKSKYLGSAILEGLGAGAGSYMDMQQKEAEILKRRQEAATEAEETRKRAASVGLEEAATGLTGAQTLKEVLESGRLGIQQFGPADAPFYIVTLEDGTKMPLDQWIERGGNLIGGTLAADIARKLATGRSTTPSPATTTVETAKEAINTPSPLVTTPPAPAPVKQPPLTQPVAPIKLTPGVIYDDESRKLAQEDKKIKFSTDPSLVRTAEESRKIYAPKTMLDANAARDNTPYLNELSETLAKAYKGKGLATPGTAATARSQIIKAADTLYRALGGTERLSALPEASDVTGKITSLLGRESAASAGQESYAALNAIKEAIPNLEMDPRAGAKLAAELMVLRKRSLDREEHMKAWSRDSGGILYNAQKNFSEKNPDAKYQIAQQVISDMMIHHPDAFERIMSGTVSRDSIEKQIRAEYGGGVPAGISEFFPSLETTRRKTP